MAAPWTNLLLQIAGSGLSGSEIRAFAKWVERNGPDHLVEVIERLRNDASAQGFNTPPGNRNFVPTSSNLVMRLENLLLTETGIPKRLAAERLVHHLESAGPSPPPYSKNSSFEAWLTRISEIIPESVLLYAATKVRNEFVHVSKSDWPLKGSDR